MKKSSKTARFISMRNTFVVVYTLLAAAIFAVTCIYFINSNTQKLLIQSESYTFASATQSQRSVENFYDDIDRAQNIIYDDPEYISFFPSKVNATAEELRMMDKITEMLTKASYHGPYADLGIVYRNGLSAGFITEGIKDFMGSNLFQRSLTIMEGKDSCWTVLYYQNVSRAKEKLCIIVRENPALFRELLWIINRSLA